MTSRKLVTYVSVSDENGERRTYGPGDDVPEQDAKRITNPRAWGKEPAPAAKSEPAKSEPAQAEHAEDASTKGSRKRSS